jgi:hypothetical protein
MLNITLTMDNVQLNSDLFQTANGFYLEGSVTTTIQHTNTHVTYTQIHTSHKITPLKSNKQPEENISHLTKLYK